jgi:hypothetical protein
LVNTALPRRASKEALKRETIMPWFNDFHGPGVNPGSWVFLQSKKLKRIPLDVSIAFEHKNGNSTLDLFQIDQIPGNNKNTRLVQYY